MQVRFKLSPFLFEKYSHSIHIGGKSTRLRGKKARKYLNIYLIF